MTYRLDEQLENIYKKIKKELIEKFLKDWNKIWAVKPIESAYTHYSITEEEYKAIKEKWEKKLDEYT